MAPVRQVGPAAKAIPKPPAGATPTAATGMKKPVTAPVKVAAPRAVPIPQPPKPAAKAPVQVSKTSSVSEAPLAAPERRTPPRPSSNAAPATATEATKAPMEAESGKKSAAMEEMSKRAAAVRGVQAEKKADGTTDGVAPVVVPRKKAAPDSPAAKALAAKKEEIAKKIASGSVAAPSKSMAVGVPTKAASSTAVQAPSIKERYATEGSSPLTAKTDAVKAPTPNAAKIPAEAKAAQQAVNDAMKEASNALGRAVHIHVHAPVHIHIGNETNRSKL